jgi:hypothetical protein
MVKNEGLRDWISTVLTGMVFIDSQEARRIATKVIMMSEAGVRSRSIKILGQFGSSDDIHALQRVVDNKYGDRSGEFVDALARDAQNAIDHIRKRESSKLSDGTSNIDTSTFSPSAISPTQLGDLTSGQSEGQAQNMQTQRPMSLFKMLKVWLLSVVIIIILLAAWSFFRRSNKKKMGG